jgi:rhodanese-related sulfurtransferase
MSSSSSSFTTIAVEKLARLVGTPRCPAVVDVRTEEDFAAEPRLIPGAVRRPHGSAPAWAGELAGGSAVVVCRGGRKLSEGMAAWLRHEGVPAEALAGGSDAWAGAGLPLVPVGKLPARDGRGRTVWVTRARPKIDRIACPWLVRRFVDPRAEFAYLPTAEVLGAARRDGSIAYDIPGGAIEHDGELCSFDVMLREFGLRDLALDELARIVRGADTDRLDLTPQSAGLLAVSLGLGQLYTDDRELLERGLLVYDALYAWCRHARGETHGWDSAAMREATR